MKNDIRIEIQVFGIENEVVKSKHSFGYGMSFTEYEEKYKNLTCPHRNEFIDEVEAHRAIILWEEKMKRRQSWIDLLSKNIANALYESL